MSEGRERPPRRTAFRKEMKTMSSQQVDPSSPSQGSPPPAPPQAAPNRRLPQSPGLAAFLSLFPGLGQVYNGQIARAFAFFFAWVGSIYLTANGHEFPFAFVIPFVHLYNMIDAWKGASAVNQRFLGGRSEPEEATVESPVWGGILVAFGIVILLSNLGWLDLDKLARWWPVLLIGVGAWLLFASIQKKKADEKAEEHVDEPPSL
jgi:TM2 domain-containing membrane protein YozV